jgi:hypothetical protein
MPPQNLRSGRERERKFEVSASRLNFKLEVNGFDA